MTRQNLHNFNDVFIPLHFSLQQTNAIMLTRVLFPLMYSTAQFKLDRTRVQQGHDMTHFSFRTHASLHVHVRIVTSNLPCKALVYALDMCTMHAWMSGVYTPNLDYTCMQIVSQGQWNKLYKHVYVLKCNPLMIQDVNPAKEYLTVKLKRLEGVPLSIIIGNSQISFNVTN